MNFRVRCIETKDGDYIKGKIYSVSENGEIIDETGYGKGVYNNTESFEKWCRSCNWQNYKFELVEEEKPFTKDDLKVGYVVERRDGDLKLILPYKNGLVATNGHGLHQKLDAFTDELISRTKPEYDLVKVYGLANMGGDAVNIGTNGRPLLWQRAEIIELTAEEAYKIIAKKKGVPVESLRVKWEG